MRSYAFFVEDVSQEVLIASWMRWRDVTPPPPWVRKVAVRQYLLYLRRHTRRVIREGEYARFRAIVRRAEEFDSEQRMIRGRMLEQIFGTSVGALGDLGRCSLAEIARSLNIPRGTVYRRIFEARSQHERASRRRSFSNPRPIEKYARSGSGESLPRRRDAQGGFWLGLF